MLLWGLVIYIGLIMTFLTIILLVLANRASIKGANLMPVPKFTKEDAVRAVESVTQLYDLIGPQNRNFAALPTYEFVRNFINAAALSAPSEATLKAQQENEALTKAQHEAGV